MSLEHLRQARALTLPPRGAVLRRDLAVRQFWVQHQHLLGEAWREWEAAEARRLPPLGTLLDASLRDAVERAWDDPSREAAVRDLWEPVAPGVFQCQLFEPSRLAVLRRYLDEVSGARIPLRPPYGIVLNRGGAMLDPRSEGFLAAPSFQAVYRELLDRYMRPCARLLFPEIVGYDAQSFGFSIRYEPGTDRAIRAHTDASSVTLNVNLNLPGEAFAGSRVDFLDPASGAVSGVVFSPGVAVIHRGRVPHAAQPITSGERSNLVLWLYGAHGRVPPQGAAPRQLGERERWSVPAAPADAFAPF